MALLDFVKPKWQHSDPQVRLDAVEKMNGGDTDTLLSLILADPNHGVRSAAIGRINDLDILTGIDRQGVAEQTVTVLDQRIDTFLTEKVLAPPDFNVPVADIRLPTDPQMLARIAVESESPDIRIATINQINDTKLLGQILLKRSGNEPARIAIAKINDIDILTNLAANASGKTARRLAQEKVTAIAAENNKPSAAELLDQRLEELCSATETLAQSSQWQAGPTKLSQLKEKWHTLTAATDHPLTARFNQACAEFDQNLAAYEQGCAAENEKAARYTQRLSTYESICTTAEGLANSRSDNAGTEFQELQTQWRTAQEDTALILPPTAALQNRFADAEKVFQESRQRLTREQQRLVAFTKDCQALEKQVAAGEIKRFADNLKKLQDGLSYANLQLVDCKDLKQRLTSLKKAYKELDAALTAAQDIARQENIHRRSNICAAIEKLVNAEKQVAAEKQAKKFLAEWAALPKLSGQEGQELEKRFQNFLRQFNQQQKKFFHDLEWQQWANKTKKEELVLTAQNLEKEDDLALVAELVKELQSLWKNIGPVPHKISQKLWDKFHASCDRNFTRCQPFFDEQEEKRQENIKILEKLCEDAAALTESSEWQDTADKLKKMQADWKKVLPVPRRKADKLFSRFRKECNLFFERRHLNYEEGDKLRRQNLKEKEALCAEAEALAEKPNWDDGSKYRQLQTKWKKIGHVPKAKEQPVWKRFRAACDKFFGWLDEQRQQNLQGMEELCQEVEQIVAVLDETDASAMRAASEKLDQLQHQWKEIGPPPLEQKESIWKRFHAPCDQFFAMRRQQFAEQDKKRLGNQEIKEDLLAKAEELAATGTGSEIAEELKKIQTQWFGLGAAPRDHETELNNNFKAACDSFFAGRRQYFDEIKTERLANLKKKEALCVRLENIVGHSSGTGTALSLAEQLKLAMQENTIMAGQPKDHKVQAEKVRRIQDEWKKIGSVPLQHDKTVWQRYKSALDIFHTKEGNKKHNG